MRRIVSALVWGCLAVTAIAVIGYIFVLPENRKAAGQIYEVQNHTWLSTSAIWQENNQNRELEIELVSVWGAGEVYYTHDRLKEFCDTVLGHLPLHAGERIARDHVDYVTLSLSRGWRNMTETGIRMQVEDGYCSNKLKPAPVEHDEKRIRRPSKAETALNAAFLKEWRNIRASFIKGSSGDGMYYEFVPTHADRSLQSFDFRQACRVAISRMPETRQTKFGLLDFLQNGVVTVRVWEREEQAGQPRPVHETRKFAIHDRDCVDMAEAHE